MINIAEMLGIDVSESESQLKVKRYIKIGLVLLFAFLSIAGYARLDFDVATGILFIDLIALAFMYLAISNFNIELFSFKNFDKFSILVIAFYIFVIGITCGAAKASFDIFKGPDVRYIYVLDMYRDKCEHAVILTDNNKIFVGRAGYDFEIGEFCKAKIYSNYGDIKKVDSFTEIHSALCNENSYIGVSKEEMAELFGVPVESEEYYISNEVDVFTDKTTQTNLICTFAANGKVERCYSMKVPQTE